MTLQDLGNIGEFIAAFGVIASLIYVGFQVRQNTRAMRAQIHENLTSGYLSIINTVAAHPTAFAKGLRSDSNFDELTDEEKVQYFGLIFGFFKHFEHMFVQHERGLIDDQAWEACRFQTRHRSIRQSNGLLLHRIARRHNQRRTVRL